MQKHYPSQDSNIHFPGKVMQSKVGNDHQTILISGKHTLHI